MEYLWDLRESVRREPPWMERGEGVLEEATCKLVFLGGTRKNGLSDLREYQPGTRASSCSVGIEGIVGLGDLGSWAAHAQHRGEAALRSVVQRLGPDCGSEQQNASSHSGPVSGDMYPAPW